MVKEHEIIITISIGISLYPKDGVDPVTLIKHADLAMYKSKNVGRNNYSFFSIELYSALEKESKIINALKVALKNKNEFTVFYQPKISIKTKKIVGAEALIRWNSSELGPIGPSEFIPIAEKTHLIIEIGKYVLEKACYDFVKLKNNGHILHQISINISGVQLQYSNIFETVQEVMSTTGIHSSELELEVTESYIATNEIRAIETLGKFRDMGIALAIDDFGTGYSSMSYMQKLPITHLKIDKVFVDDLPDSKESVAIVRAIIALAKAFDLKITIEGIETQKQLDFFDNDRCDNIQGFIYSKPISLDALKEFIIKNS